MSVEPIAPGQPIQAGRLLGDAFKVYGANFVPFTVIALIALLPYLAYMAWFIFSIETLADLQKLAGTSVWILVVVELAFTYICQAGIVYGTVEYLAGRKASVGSAVGRGMAVLFPVLGVALATGLVTVLGFLALIIPGFIVLCGLFVAVPAAVVERKGVGDAMRRSWDITSGSRWAIFGAIFVLGILNTILDKVLQAVLLDQSSLASVLSSIKIYLLVVTIVGIVVTCLQATMSAVAYSHLRESREGVTADELAEIFA